jgi:hypothetical protein
VPVKSVHGKGGIAAGFAAGLLLAARIACAAPQDLRAAGSEDGAPRTDPEEPRVHPTLPWFLTQLVPSPEIAGGRHAGPELGMRWQVTPLLYSWGVHRGLSPWRFLVAEPLVRQSGSVELHVTPEYFPGYGSSFGDGWMARTGVRTYLPLVAHGEYLSASVGASYFHFAGRSGAAYEAGLYVLFGIVGVQVTGTPSPGPFAWIATLRLRYF